MPRAASEKDVAGVRKVAEGINLFESKEEIDELIETPLKQFVNGEQEPTHQWFVADAGEGIAGATYVAPQPDEEGAFNMFFLGVLPEFQRQGHGKVLLQHVEEFARSQGARCLLVDTSPDEALKPARDFYEKSGFSCRAEVPDMFGEGQPGVQYVKDL
mmetsp:Transcript_99323/g.138015  ORF Transcript_99323/g.138015 Transcript_99323/m.138015 type:complete len:158 (-) Transcript_99323:39-512(-)